MKVKVNGTYVEKRSEKAVAIVGVACFVLVVLCVTVLFVTPILGSVIAIVGASAIVLGGLSIVSRLFRKKS